MRLFPAIALGAAFVLAACGAAGGSAPPATASRSQALHAAAQCIRTHGIPGYADPVVAADGSVFTDQRPLQDASQSVIRAVTAACRTLVAAAGFNPTVEPQAPPALVAAGVASARCLRANGLPFAQDPTPASPFTPGHGFGLSNADFGGHPPPGGKLDPTVQAAFAACRTQLDAEIRASTLSGLGQG